MKCDTVIDAIRNTTAGTFCFPTGKRKGGGKLVGGMADGVQWSGSNCMLFAKEGGMTKMHVDVQSVPGGNTGAVLEMPAVGVVRSVIHKQYQKSPVAKQAIVVHADDMQKVIDELGVNTGQESTCQYRGKLETLPEFARELREKQIRFVVVDFSYRCSYLLPAKCAHVFITNGLVESAAWHPNFKQDMSLPVSR